MNSKESLFLRCVRGAPPRSGRVRRGVAAWLLAAGLASIPTLATADPGVAPEASFTASPDPARTGETVTFDASASETDPSGALITKYEWDLDGNGTFETEDNDPITSRSYSAPQSIQVSLLVTDAEGDTDVATQALAVENRPPSAAFTISPNPALTGQAVSFDASASTDPDGGIARFDWDLDGDGEFETEDNDPTTSRSYADPAIIEVSLRVRDGEGDTDVETQSLTVQDNQLPIASFTASPDPALTEERVTFDASPSQTDLVGTPITKYEWDLDGDGEFETEDNDPTTSRSYADPANVEVTLRVTDEEGDTDVDAQRLVVENRAPTAAFRYSPRSPEAGERVEFTSRSSDPDGSVDEVRWDLDGNGRFGNARGPTAVHKFSEPGRYEVGMKVTDSDGASDEVVRRILVVRPTLRFIVPFPVVRMAGRVRRATTIVRLSVRAQRGSKVTVRCGGRSCPARAMSRRVRGRPVRFRRLERVLRPGTRIVVRVTRPGQVGKYTRFRMRARRAPERLDRCLLPGVRRPARCPNR